jgi:hypothetical protein
LLAAVAAFCLLSAEARAQEARNVPTEPWSSPFPVPSETDAQRVLSPQAPPESEVWSRTEMRHPRGPIIAGAILLFGTYATDLTGVLGNAFAGGPSRENWLAVPFAGPLVLMAQTTNAPGNMLLAADALLQAGGLAMFVYGLTRNVPTVVKWDMNVSAAPWLGPGHAGIGLHGSF